MLCCKANGHGHFLPLTSGLLYTPTCLLHYIILPLLITIACLEWSASTEDVQPLTDLHRQGQDSFLVLVELVPTWNWDEDIRVQIAAQAADSDDSMAGNSTANLRAAKAPCTSWATGKFEPRQGELAASWKEKRAIFPSLHQDSYKKNNLYSFGLYKLQNTP